MPGLVTISYISQTIPFIVVIYFLRQLWNGSENKRLIMSIIVLSSFQLLEIMVKAEYYYKLYTIVEFLVLASLLIKWENVIKEVMAVFGIVMMLVILFFEFYLDRGSYDVFSVSVECSSLLIISARVITVRVLRSIGVPFYIDYKFYFALAVMVMSFGTLLSMQLAGYVYSVYIHSPSNIIFNLLLSGSVMCSLQSRLIMRSYYKYS